MFPEPNYDRDIERLINAYKRAVRGITAELSRMDLTDMSRAQATAALKEVAEILSELNDESAEWVVANIPIAVTDGITRAIIDLGVVATIEEARDIVKFNRTNREMVAAAIADTQADLLAVTQNVDRRVRQAVRQATADGMRANMAAGINGRRTISADILQRMRQTLNSAVETGIIDAAGRRWKPEVYVETVVRTKMMRAQIDGTINEALDREVMYGRISSHGAKDACRNWEGRIVKLTPDAPGDYPEIGALPRREIFHPRCKHVVSPIRRPE
ncbi:phage minor capsid protein [Paenibacillus shunpengii]|uniref:Phage minor capsid protein n=1 Tax=Paenibacillus shunpengii TaxID=2054424 RepID=A0ABW5SU91_9BACL